MKASLDNGGFVCISCSRNRQRHTVAVVDKKALSKYALRVGHWPNEGVGRKGVSGNKPQQRVQRTKRKCDMNSIKVLQGR
jgi:hypothetical protein